MRAAASEEAMIQNLRDAGCSPATIADFIDRYRKNQMEEVGRILSRHRRFLLDRVHQEERKIACLDYLIYQIKKGG